MPETPDLAAILLAHAKVCLVPPLEAAALSPLLFSAWENARARWPTVKLAPELFVKHLAERLPGPVPHGSLELLFKPLFMEDLYLACACVHQVPVALETFEQHILRKLPGLLRNHERSAAEIDEICQETRVRLLVSTPSGPPKLIEYMGTGALLNWVKVIAVRIGQRLSKARKLPAKNEPTPESIFPPGQSLEIDVLKRYHHEDLRGAMQQAFSMLSDEDLYLFRLYYVKRLSMYEMEPLLKMSQPTISRRLKNAREKIQAETLRHLQARIGLPPHEFESFLKCLDSQFDVRISQLLGQTSAPRGTPENR